MTKRRSAALVIVARDIDNPARAGGDRHVCLLGEYLAKRGFDVEILCSSHPSVPPRAERNGTRVRRLAWIRSLAPLVWILLLTGYAQKYDLVVEEMIGGTRIPFFAPLFTRRPIVGFWYQDNVPIFRAQYGPFRQKLAARVQSLVIKIHHRAFIICPSSASRSWIIGQGYSDSSVGVFYPSADPYGLADSSLPFGRRLNRFISIGNIRPMKRFEQAIDVLAILRRQVVDAELVVVGRADDAEYLRDLSRKSEQLGLKDCVKFEIGISERRKYDLLAKSKVLTIHSATEGFGLSVIEAGLCGVPSVVNSGVPSEVVEDGLTGLRVPEGDSAGFAERVGQLMTDASRWNLLSHGAKGMSMTFKEARADEHVDSIVRLFEAPFQKRGE